MEKDFNTSVKCDSSHLNDTESEQSIVGKFKSIINNTPLSKWFRKQDDNNRSTIRRRDEEFEDEDLCQMQPPSKRVKLPSNARVNDCDGSFEAPSRPLTKNDGTSTKKFKYFPEPVAGPSGIKSRKTLNAVCTSVNAAQSSFGSSEILNGHKDSDSEESTSGYSSVARISSKEHVCQSQESSKQTSPTQNVATPNNARAMFPATNTGMNRSLFTERTPKHNMNTSMSSRRPSFNVSTFGSPNFMDKTLATKKIINSPFYNGRTVYGGASAYGRSLGRSSQDLRQNLKNSVRMKPVNQPNENGDLVLGKTARRILETLEQYSSPVSDAKKIPVAAKKQPKDGILTRYIGANPYLVRESRVASNKELQVPSVLDLLQLKQKTRLQDVTETVKQIAKSSKSDLNIENYKLGTVDSDKAKHTGKMKTKVSSVRQKQQVDEAPPEVNLKPVSLPITTMPKFDLDIPPPVAALPTAKTPDKSTLTSSSVLSSSSLASTVSLETQPSPKPETEKTVQINKQDPTPVEYKFSNPLIIAENLKSIVAMNNFKFSEPLCKKKKYATSAKASLNFKMPDNKSPVLISKKNNGESGVKPTAMLKSGSVMDVLDKKSNDSLLEKFKPEQGTWECGTCMIRNQPGRSKCAACETARSAPKTTTTSDNKNEFGSQFKMTTDKWECGTCLVRNDKSESKCVSCSASKPLAKNTFKVPENTWECPTCMIRNKNDATKCAACETANPKSASPSTVSTKVSPPTSTTWECSCCLVRNKEDAAKCIACEAIRKTATKTTNSFGASFKMNNDEWECCVCMVRNKSSNEKCQCCEAVKPGSVADKKDAPATEQKSTLKFNFGIDKAAATAFNFGIPAAAAAASQPKPVVNPVSVFGAKVETTTSPSFSFGITKEQPKTADSAQPEQKVATAPAVTAPAAQKANPLLKSNEKLPEKASPAPAGFKFEVPAAQKWSPKPATAPPAVTTTSEPPMFNYTPPATMFSDSSFIATATKPGTNMFSFGAKPTAAAAPLVSTVAQAVEKPAAAAPVFAFGSSSKPVETPAPSVNNVVTGFGKINATSFNMPASTFSSEVKPFSFKNDTSGTGEPPSKAPMFSFGQSAGKAPSAAFNFNQSTSAPAFNFTGDKTDVPTTSGTATLFGASSTSGKNGMFNFGTVASNNNSQKAVFSFGAPANNAASSAATSGFNFGGAATASTPAPASGGFNFSAGAPPSFDVNAKPSFNFTDGSVTTFAAQPTAEGGMAMAPPRKIKKAVRRTQR